MLTDEHVREACARSLEQSRARRDSQHLRARDLLLAAGVAFMVIAAGVVFCAYVLYLLA